MVKIVGAFRIHTFMDAEKLPVFFRNHGMTTMRADQSDRSCSVFTRRKSVTADFALKLTVAAIVVVYKMVRGTAYRTEDILGDGFTIPTLDRSESFSVFPLIVFEKELPVLFDKCFDNRELINLKLLILWGMGIIECPLFERNISADKI